MDLAEWEARFSRIRRSTILQSYDYARAVCPIYGQRARWGLIVIDGREAGLVQMLEAGFFGLHAMTIDRGPLWFSGFGGIAHLKVFYDALNKQFPKRFGRKRRMIPEMPSSPAGRALIAQSGWTHIGPDYTTVWVDLTQTEDSLRSALRKNWRNHLTKIERDQILTIDWSQSTEFLSWLVDIYEIDQATRGYPGPKGAIVLALGNSFGAHEKCLIGRAMLDNRCVAAILVLLHGCSATYQIGWSDADGRKHGGHYRLLWDALAILRGAGISDFDLGGINDTTADGVSDFKDGLGGQRITLAGLYT